MACEANGGGGVCRLQRPGGEESRERTGERKNAGWWGKNAVPVRGPSVVSVGVRGSLVGGGINRGRGMRY